MKAERNDEGDRNDESESEDREPENLSELESANETAAERNLRYGNAFGTQRDRSGPESGGYLDPEFGDEPIPIPDRGGSGDSEATDEDSEN